MLTEVESQGKGHVANQEALPGIRPLSERHCPDPKLLKDALPYLYLTGGFAAFFATLYISEWFWVLPHSILLFAACLHLAVTVGGRPSKSGQRS